MMRHATDEEIELLDKLHNDKSLSEDDKKKIIERLKQIDWELTKDYPFAH